LSIGVGALSHLFSDAYCVNTLCMRLQSIYARNRLAGFLLIVLVGDTVFVRNLKIACLLIVCVVQPVQAESGAALFGAAAIAGAVTPAVVAGIQAGADRDIAGVDAATRMYLNDSNNRLSLSLGGMQMGTSLALSQMQMQTALYANSQMTLRQQMQLDAVARTNALNYQMQSQQMQTDYALRFASLQMQEKAMDWNYRTGLAQGGQTASFAMRSDGDGLSVRSYGLAAGGGSLAAATPLLTTTPGSQSSATSRLLSSVQGQPVVPVSGALPARAASPVRVPARALAPINGRVAPKPAPVPEWVRHAPISRSHEPVASSPDAPLVSGGHKNPGF
jgi:hypothetical protein